MSVRIRFKRVGRPHAPYFRIVAVDQRKSPTAAPLESLGTVNPHVAVKPDELHADRIRYWLSVGAQPSERVVKTLKKAGVWNQVKPGAQTKA